MKSTKETVGYTLIVFFTCLKNSSKIRTCERPRYMETVSEMYKNLPSLLNAKRKPSRACGGKGEESQKKEIQHKQEQV